MVGNTQADTSGNILVELDENNIIVVDPNKTTDNFETPMPPPPSYFFQSLCKIHTGNGGGGEK